MTAPAEVEAKQVARDVSDGAEQKNISKALQEIHEQKKSMSPAEYNDFLKNVNNKLHDGDASNGEAAFYIYDVDDAGKELIVAREGKAYSLDKNLNSKDSTVNLSQAAERGYRGENNWGGGKFSEETNGGVFRAVEPGDTVWDTARKYLKEKNKGEEPSPEDIAKELKKIKDANPQLGDDLNKIKPGQRIYIPEDEVKAIRAARGENHVKIDAQKGHVEISHPDGSATSIDYNPATKAPTKISMADKSTWTPKEGGGWEHKDASGKVIGEGKVSTDASGNLIVEDSTGKQKVTIDTRTGGIKAEAIVSPPDGKIDEAEQRKMSEEANKFAPKDGIYNPVSPPGSGDVTPGQTLDGETETGSGNTVLDYRNCTTEEKPNGEIEIKYDGEIEDSGYMPWNWGDTNFEGKETWKDGKLQEREVKYPGGAEIKFSDPGRVPAEQTISDVTKVHTKLVDGKYVTKIECADGTTYSTVTSSDGRVLSFKKN